MCLSFSIPTGTVFNNISLECAMAHFKVFYFNCAGVCIIIIVFLPVYYLEAAPVTATPVESCRCLGLGFFFFYCMSIARHSPVKHNGKSREQHENL